MLYPKEDKIHKTLLYACRICTHQEPATSPCIYRNEISKTSEEATIVIHDIATDPTLPRTNARCAKCGHREAVYFQSSSTRSGEGMTLYFVCCAPNCGYRWKE